MWVDSKNAASLLHIKYDALQKAINRAQKKIKNFALLSVIYYTLES